MLEKGDEGKVVLLMIMNLQEKEEECIECGIPEIIDFLIQCDFCGNLWHPSCSPTLQVLSKQEMKSRKFYCERCQRAEHSNNNNNNHNHTIAESNSLSDIKLMDVTTY